MAMGGPAAAALIRPLAWELPYAMGTALKRWKKKKYTIRMIYCVLPFFHFREVTEIREFTRKSVPRNSSESAEYIKVITGLLNAKDFRDRINGIKQLLSDTENNQELVVGNIVKVRTVKINFHF